MRDAYAAASRETGVRWSGTVVSPRGVDQCRSDQSGIVGGEQLLYGVCHAAIVSAGYSPALGFVHRGKGLSFVYDVADLYKTDVTIPVAFRTVAESAEHVERRVRYRMRDSFRAARMLPRLIADLESLFALGGEPIRTATNDFDIDEALPGGLWDPGSRGGRRRRELCRLRRRSAMVVLVLERVPTSLRGELTRWMLEPKAGVFVGTMSAFVREQLWEKVSHDRGVGAGMLVYSSDIRAGIPIGGVRRDHTKGRRLRRAFADPNPMKSTKREVLSPRTWG